MNKTKKIAIAAVSVVMAGAMMLPLAACGKKKPKLEESQPKLEVKVDADGKLSYANTTTLRLSVGYDKATDTATTYTTENQLVGNATPVPLPDGKSYKVGDLKPAWAALAEQLQLKFEDKYVSGLGSDTSITTPDTANELGNYDIITGSCAAIQSSESKASNPKFLDLNQYLDYMPNYKYFLSQSPLTYLSLTSDTKTGAMYYAPYFDGNDDIEKYTLVQRSWARKILDGADYSAATTTLAGQASAKQTAGAVGTQTTDAVALDATEAHIESFMGKTGSWEIDVIPKDADLDQLTVSTEKVKVNYDAAKTAATTAGQALYQAIYEAAGNTAYTGDSGNIVDLQNFAINETDGAVTGAQLIKILREYIKVAYQKPDGSQYYTTLSDVFCGENAAWDVDLLAAMCRCVVTSYDLLGDSIAEGQTANDLFAFGGRASTTQRIADLYAFAGELYGVRGLESRFEFTYIDKDGALHDARENTATWDALARIAGFAKEGLVYTGDAAGTDRPVYTSDATKRGPVLFLEHDYLQTQTQYGFYNEADISTTSYNVPTDFDFSPIMTAVSNWDDGTGAKKMRFTESWRSVKNTGFCVPYESVKDKPEKLAAVLAFIDYFFSKDGQILMSYGPQSTNGNTTPNGWWYATEQSGVSVTDTTKFKKIADATNYAPAQYESVDGSYFAYNGKVYKGLDYAGRQVPVMTDASLKAFKGIKFDGTNKLNKYTLSYTNYARKVIGSALPIGNKDQGFEYQCTAECGLDGAALINAALYKAKTIKHVYQQIENELNNTWYTIAPTLYPLTTTQSSAMDDQLALTDLFGNSSKILRNAFVSIMYNGYSNGKLGTSGGSAVDMPADAQGIVNLLNDSSRHMDVREAYLQDAWKRLVSYYDDFVKPLLEELN